MVGALGLIGVQFLVQYTTRLRDMGVIQAVLANLAFFVPASSLMNLTILNLQRQGRLTRFERWGWGVVTLLIISGLAIAVATDGQPLAQLSDRVLWTEIAMSFVYAVIQTYYCVLQFRELVRMEGVIEDYYDRDQEGLTKWMKHAVAVNGLLAVFVPLLIFGPNIVITVFSLTFFWGIFLMWFSFVRFFTSNAMYRVREAEASAAESDREERADRQNILSEGGGLSSDVMLHVSRVIERWLATNNHLKAGITSSAAAKAMSIPRYQLTAWVKASGHLSFSKWIIALRIEEAKRLLAEHRDWSIETIAEKCGFNRTHFQKVFQEHTGTTPAKYLSVLNNAGQ